MFRRLAAGVLLCLPPVMAAYLRLVFTFGGCLPSLILHPLS